MTSEQFHYLLAAGSALVFIGLRYYVPASGTILTGLFVGGGVFWALRQQQVDEQQDQKRNAGLQRQKRGIEQVKERIRQNTKQSEELDQSLIELQREVAEDGKLLDAYRKVLGSQFHQNRQGQWVPKASKNDHQNTIWVVLEDHLKRLRGSRR